jgi:tRNA pseudouridine32 synthase/23S rRNA pseudouridine746 synthase
MNLPILYQDLWLLAINKPANLLSVPAKDPCKENCYQYILQHLPQAKVIHRLDEPTSGVMLFALDNKVEQHLHKQFRQRQVNKEYIAVVQGVIKKNQGKIEAPLKVDWANRPKQKICWQHGKESLTEWQVLRNDTHQTRLKLTPHSGRTHQLRLHMSSISHPIIGDSLYNPSSQTQYNQRLLLHSKTLTFTHPISLIKMRLEAPCPF